MERLAAVADTSLSGKPTQRACAENFKGRMRNKRLNAHLFLSMNHARVATAAWVHDFNNVRPHASLGYLTSAAFAETLRPQRAPALRHMKSSAPNLRRLAKPTARPMASSPA